MKARARLRNHCFFTNHLHFILLVRIQIRHAASFERESTLSACSTRVELRACCKIWMNSMLHVEAHTVKSIDILVIYFVCWTAYLSKTRTFYTHTLTEQQRHMHTSYIYWVRVMVNTVGFVYVHLTVFWRLKLGIFSDNWTCKALNLTVIKMKATNQLSKKFVSDVSQKYLPICM